MNRRSATLSLMGAVLAGCASKSTIPYHPISVRDYSGKVLLPPLYNTVTVNVGDQMIATRTVAILPKLVVASQLVIETPYDSSVSLLSRIAPGDYSLVATDKAGGNYFRQSDGVRASWKSLDGKNKDYDPGDHLGGIFVSPTGKASLYIMWDGYPGPSSLHPAPGLDFSTGTLEVELPGQQLHKELLYLGVSQSTITLRYREYWRGVARPDVAVEVRYDLSQGRSIGYRDSRFEVLEATNTSIKYRAIAHLQ